jgi:ABC-type dipeptide/oligopeptide/nickel transport system permease component
MKMRDYVVRRLLLLVPTLFGLVVIVFIVSHVVPGDPAQIWFGAQQLKAREEQIMAIRMRYHLNEPLYMQFYYFLVDLLHGDMGTSPLTGRPVMTDIQEFFPNTVELAVAAMIMSLVLGIPLGILSAVKKDTMLDHLTRLFALGGVSMPEFWIGLLLQITFYYYLHIFPDPGGRMGINAQAIQHITGFPIVDSLITGNWSALMSLLQHMAMPTFTLGISLVALISRMVRSSMLEVLRQDYIRTARAGGLAERVVIYKHALRNALIPTLTVVGMAFGWLLCGSVVVETVFYWPGIGKYSVGAVMHFDFPAILAFVLITGTIYSLSNFLVDIAYAHMNPTIRLR